MKIAALFAIASFGVCADTLECVPVRVIDGDTIVCSVSDANGARNERVRVVGVDTPEMRAHCPAEREQAIAATTATSRAIFRAKRVELKIEKRPRDKYGRLLARVSVDGQDLAGMLLASGLGSPYNGEKRRNWCATVK